MLSAGDLIGINNGELRHQFLGFAAGVKRVQQSIFFTAARSRGDKFQDRPMRDSRGAVEKPFARQRSSDFLLFGKSRIESVHQNVGINQYSMRHADKALLWSMISHRQTRCW